MKAGQLDSRISIYGIGIVEDSDYGPQPGQPIVVANRIPAQVQDVLPSKAESVENGLALARNRTRIRIRYQDGIDSSMTVIIHDEEDRELNIIGGPAILGDYVGIEIMCEELSS